MNLKSVTFISVVFLCVIALPSLATDIPWIWADSTATLLTEPGPHQDWYLYEVYVEWDLNGAGTGLSHWDVILETLCDPNNILVEFDTPAGYSTSIEHPNDPTVLGWSGYWEPDGDPTVPGNNAAIKFNEPHFPLSGETPGEEGRGTFYYYATAPPQYGTFPDAVVAKYGAGETFGDLTGAYPSCIPEPTVTALLGIGALALFFKRRTT